MVLGVSPDSAESHRKFIKKYDLKFDLLADTDKSVMKAYKAFDKRVKRSTVIISPKGILAHHFPNVNPRKHIEEVKETLAKLQKK